jgi:histidyl-tRNA synthetase
VIDLLGHLYARLGLSGVRLHLTSIGTPESRQEYARELREFLLRSDVFDSEQRRRIEQNPMRAFDWDDARIQKVTEKAPKMLDRLSDDDRQHFEEVRRLLDGAGIDYDIDPRLVRGLDYYTRTVFEFRSDALGAQSGIGGGGRYDRLIEQIGGDPTPGVGWATGLERIAQAMKASGSTGAAATSTSNGDALRFLFAVTEPAARQRVFRAVSELREEGLGATMDLGERSLKSQMKHAARTGVPWVVIVGPDEWSRDAAVIRDMSAHRQEEVSLSMLRHELVRRARVG